MAVLTLGTKQLSAPAGAVAASGTTLNQRAIVDTVFVAPDGGWIATLGVWARATSGVPLLSLAVWLVDDAGAPADLLAKADARYLTSAGSLIEAPVDWVSPAATGGTATALRVEPGQKLALGWELHGGDGEFGYVPGGGAVTHHLQTNALGAPSNPFAAQQITNAGLVSVYALLDTGSVPTAPVPTAPADGATGSDRPVFASAFVDADVAAYGDALREVEVELYVLGQPTPFWVKRRLATAQERLDAAWSVAYDGPPLASGAVLSWRARHADDAQRWSAWSIVRTYTVQLTGAVDSSLGTPAALSKVEDSRTQSWTANYWNSSLQDADQVRLRIRYQNAAYYETGEITKAVVAASGPPGTAFTISALEAGQPDLPPGLWFEWQAQARNAVTLGWTPWSVPVPFLTNSPPTVPAILQPPEGATSTARPLLEFVSYDPNSDDVPGAGVVWEIEIFNPVTGLVATVTTSAYDAARRIASFQTTSAEVPNVGLYSWRARGRDLSAGSRGDSDWSAWRSFVYAAGQAVTVTNPTPNEVKATPTFRVAWSAADQIAASVHLYPENATAQLAQWNAATDRFVDIGGLLDGGYYDLLVNVLDSVGVQSASLRVPFRVALSAVGALPGVDARAIRYPRDWEPTVVRVVWSQTTLPPNQFAGYKVYRRVGSAGLFVPIARLDAANLVLYDDPHAPPGEALAYSVTQIRTVNGAKTESGIFAFTLPALALKVPVLTSVRDPARTRLPLAWSQEAPRRRVTRARSLYRTWDGGGKPIVFRAPGSYRSFEASFALRSDPFGTLAEHVADAERVAESGHTFSLRGTQTGERWWVDVADLEWTGGGNGRRTAALRLDEVAYDERAD